MLRVEAAMEIRVLRRQGVPIRAIAAETRARRPTMARSRRPATMSVRIAKSRRATSDAKMGVFLIPTTRFGPHGLGGIAVDHLADDEPVKEHSHRRHMLLYGRRCRLC